MLTANFYVNCKFLKSYSPKSFRSNQMFSIKKAVLTIIVGILISQFKPTYVPKNLENAPVQILIQLCHCLCYENFFHYL